MKKRNDPDHRSDPHRNICPVLRIGPSFGLCLIPPTPKQEAAERIL